MEENNRNFILAIVLSIVVILAWDMFYARPKMQKTKLEEQTRLAQEKKKADRNGAGAVKPGEAGSPTPASKPSVPSSVSKPGVSVPALSREAALTAWSSERIPIDTPSLKGSIALKGGRIDDLILKKFRETVNPDSPPVVLLSPAGGPNPYFTDYGWTAEGSAGSGLKLPDSSAEWKAETTDPLTTTHPVKLVYDAGGGVVFHRTISIDDNYLLTVKQEVENRSEKAISLKPYGIVVRQGAPSTRGGWLLHEGLIGVLGDKGLQTITYANALKSKATFTETSGWLGFTDKYWAVTLIPNQAIKYDASMFGSSVDGKDTYQTDLVSHLFAGAKEVGLINHYETSLKINHFDLLIDWGWFYFLTKPMFFLLDFFYKLVGNFGVSILVVTVVIKLLFFPLANRSYVSMGRMKKIQPEVERIRERFPDDKMRQQQAIMELYKRENVNPLSGCLPILIQIPVFFSLYKVLYTTIEMRQAPFFGWIHDLSVPDPTTIFNLFGLIPWDVPAYLPALGVWPLVMGVSMFVQQRLNPAPTDPVQAQMFTWMPVVFTFMLASFPAGLVIYWTWNNTLTILQQWVIMRREGVEVKLWENLGLGRKSANSASKT
jgi:YidC/Oxa1 family membrane protein insertase